MEIWTNDNLYSNRLRSWFLSSSVFFSLNHKFKNRCRLRGGVLVNSSKRNCQMQTKYYLFICALSVWYISFSLLFYNYGATLLKMFNRKEVNNRIEGLTVFFHSLEKFKIVLGSTKIGLKLLDNKCCSLTGVSTFV